ncbi:hypothetical protein [Acidocella sp. C78]|uniref:hypothetical protein n=1 Tax=Acidocella sp. C78 TaxID=1671486 RepID=UPI00191BB40A|nr:hypothetical protein [Acidocella sp. C78]
MAGVTRQFLLVLGVALGVAPPFAVARAQGVNPAIAASETRVSLGVTASGYTYRESGGVDRESGVLPGFSAGVSRLGPALGMRDIYTGVVYDFAGGALGYQGYLQGGAGAPRPYDQSDSARFNHVEVQLGAAVPLGRAISVLPFVAIGYQSWSRNVGGGSGYGSFYHAVLAGVGAKLDYAASGRLVLSAAAEGLAVLGGGVSAPALGLSGGFGTSGEEEVRLGADWRLDNVWHVFAGLEMRHFNYAGSKPSNGVYEPTSGTFAARGEMGVTFGFR